MIENACPFAPGEPKPESIPTSSNKQEGLKNLLNRKIIFLVFSLIVLTLIYSRGYTQLDWEGSTVLFQDGYIVKMSLYTYLTGMITYFIKENRKKHE